MNQFSKFLSVALLIGAGSAAQALEVTTERGHTGAPLWMTIAKLSLNDFTVAGKTYEVIQMTKDAWEKTSQAEKDKDSMFSVGSATMYLSSPPRGPYARPSENVVFVAHLKAARNNKSE